MFGTPRPLSRRDWMRSRVVWLLRQSHFLTNFTISSFNVESVHYGIWTFKTRCWILAIAINLIASIFHYGKRGRINQCKSSGKFMTQLCNLLLSVTADIEFMPQIRVVSWRSYRSVVSIFFSTGPHCGPSASFTGRTHVIFILRHQYKPTRFIMLSIA